VDVTDLCFTPSDVPGDDLERFSSFLRTAEPDEKIGLMNAQGVAAHVPARVLQPLLDLMDLLAQQECVMIRFDDALELHEAAELTGLTKEHLASLINDEVIPEYGTSPTGGPLIELAVAYALRDRASPAG
jgi:hypothetical protein